MTKPDSRHRLERVPPRATRRRRCRRSTPRVSTPPSPTGCIAAGCYVRTATLDEPEHGLTEGVLAETDVLTWWGHMAHDEVSDEIVDRVQQRVLEGMGLIVLHSGHFSKIFKRLMGTTCNLKWREAGERERLWVVEPGHPIAQGLGEYFELPHEEMYGERFDIPAPDELVFLSWFQGGEVFRSGCCCAAARAGSSTSAPATRPIRSTTSRDPPGARKRRPLGRAAGGGYCELWPPA